VNQALPAAEAVLAIEEIKALKARYFRCVDSEDWDGLRAVFVDEGGTYELPGGIVFDSPDGLLGGIVDHHTQSEVVTVHHGHMPEIELTSPTTATGVWAMFDFVDRIRRDTGKREAFKGYGHYEETYERTSAGWRIASMKLTRIRIDWVDVSTLREFPHRGGDGGNVWSAPE
jgi:hypothetical protein